MLLFVQHPRSPPTGGWPTPDGRRPSTSTIAKSQPAAQTAFTGCIPFTDSDGTAESRTSAATATVGANARPTGAAKTVSTSEDTAYTFAAADFGFTDTDSGDTLHSVKITALPAAGKGALALDGTAVAANGTVTKAELDDGDLVYTPPANAHGDPYTTFSFKVSDGTDESASSYTITIDVTAVNDAATGQPAISGTTRVGQTLSAAKGTVADVDGMPADSSFAWQWIRVDGSTESNISGATAGTYTLVAADAGKKVKVKLSFTDSDGTAESRTSAATATVGANARPTGAAKTVSTSEDTAYTFAAADFGFSDTDSGDALHSVKITALPAAGKGALALDGTAVAANGTVTKAELDDGDLVYTPPANAHGDPYTTFTFKVSDGTDESASSYTITIDVTAVNDAATGQPAISGTTRVGQTLTAAKGTVADVDGMPADSSFAWQWIRVDGSSESNISGATAGTYTLAAADQGKKLKVKLSFTDSDGTAESRTSAATATVGANARPTGAAKTVSTSEDTAYTFAAADFGFTDTDSGDTLHSVKITAPPAAGKGALALDGTAVAANGTVTKAELDDGDLVYTPPANENGSGYASFSFKVSDGTAESAAAYTITIDVTAVNDAATGQPTISGTARVGQTLSAAKGTVADVDGMPADSSFAWQWIRVDGSSESNISGATAGTYTLAAADQGKKLKVKLSFTDSDGTAESRTSAATATVGANARPTGAAKTVSTSEDTAYTFAAADFGFTDTDSGDTLHSVKITALPAAGKGALALDGTAVAANGTVTKAELDDGDLVYTPPANAHGDPYTTFTFKVSDGTDESASSYTITIDVTAVNDAATGQPAISGTTRVGQTLTAAKGTVADVDGMPADSSFAWQWIRVDGSSESNISGATAGTYTLAAADQGKKLKVKLSFTDSDGTAESRTSAATATVGANARPTGAAKTVSTSEDTAYTFAAADFGFSDTDSGDALHSVKITALPAAGKGALALDGTAVAANGTVTKAELDDGDLVYTPPANAHGDPYTTFTFKVSDGTDESASSYTITIDVTAVNDAATGQPAISGTTRVGQTLTAAKGTVADVDGMPADSSFAWQWIRVDGSSESNISGATAGTYTLAAADQGKKLKVKLSFTDSDGTAESRTSAATATVGANARPTGAAKTVSTSEDTAYTFAAADFGFTDTDSGDTLHSVKITALPAAGKGALALDGTAVAANGTVTKAELDDGDLVYTPPANAHGDPYTTFTFKVSDGTDESASSYTITIDVTAVNDAATGQPTISGTARVGQTLSAAKGTVADVDGMPADSSFAWQWIRVDGSSESNISGATAGTYTLVAADEGKKVKVKLSFTDSDGTAESRTSAATATVGANARPTGAAKTVSTSEDTAYTFAAADFGFTDTDSGDTLHSVKITAPPAAGKGALALDGTAVAANGTVTKAELDDGDLVYTPPANENGSGYASFSFKVSDGTAESAAAYTITIDVTAVNDAATGQPTISGTARVGQTLSAAKGTVADVDGMPADSSFAWQWIRVDGSSESNISGATAGTYTLAAADQGKKLKVKLSFTDSDGTAESRTSAATATVGANARPTGAAKTVSTSEDTAYTFAAADFGFTDTDSGDTLHSVKITAPPAAGKGALALDGTAVAANGTVTKAELDDGDLVYTPPANENGSGYASFSFKVSDGTAESAAAYTITIDVTAVNDAATGQPTISGTARVGQTLSAAKGTVADVDGMPADSSFAWQWIRVDGSTESDISGATAGTYTLAAADQGKKLKVKLSFTDSDGTAESRTSAATSTMLSGLVLTVEMVDEEVTEGEPVRYRIVMSRPTGWISVGTRYEYQGQFMFQEPWRILGGMRSHGDRLYWEREEATVDDGKAEADGKYTVRLEPGAGYTLGTPSSATVRILDNDVPTVTGAKVSANNARVVEGPGAVLEFPVTLDNALANTVTLDWSTADGDAEAGRDYEAGSGTLTFQPGETAKTVRIVVLDDDLDEGPECMLLEILNVSGADVDSESALAVGSIEPPPETVSSATDNQKELTCSSVPSARFESVPESHDGSSPFELELHFDAEPDTLSSETVVGGLLEVTGGTVAAARPMTEGSKREWLVTVQPSGEDEVFVTVSSRPCDAADAVCFGGTPLVLGAAVIVPFAAPEQQSDDDTRTDGAGASFESVPKSHDGSSTFTLELHFTKEPDELSYRTVRDSLLTVTDGNIIAAKRKDPPSNRKWQLTVRPSGNAPVSLAVNSRACDEAETVCFGGEPLAVGAAMIVPGPPDDRSVSTQTAPVVRFNPSFSGLPGEHDGGAFQVTFDLGAEPAGLSYRTVRDSLFWVTGGSITAAKRMDRPNKRKWRLTVKPSGFGDVTISLRPTKSCAGTPGVCLPDGRKLTALLSMIVRGPVTLSVADATVKEAADASLAFAVSINRARAFATTVAYATSDGTATAGSDYTATSGTLTFAAGETSKTIRVPVLDDTHDEGSETLTLTLSNPSPSAVKLADASATGTIVNSDAMPKAWTARFGRTVAEQVLDAVGNRMQAERAPGVEVSLAGERIGWHPGEDRGPGADGAEAWQAAALREEEAERGAGRLSAWLGGENGTDEERYGATRTVTGQELLFGSSFALTAEAGGPGSGLVSVWGRGAVSHFDGRDGDLSIDGEVASGMFGADFSRGRTMAGLIVGHSTGKGGYRAPAGGGTVSSTLTGLYPWGRYAATERIEVWGAAGYGEGTLTLEPDGQNAMRTDLGLWMAAAGLRGMLVDGGADGLTLTAKTDAMTVTASTEAVPGELASTRAEVTRLRLGLEGTLPVRFEDGSVLTPGIEIGVRHDGGDAETGFGADIGAGVAWADPARGLSAELRARGLLTHESDGFRDRGISGALGWDPVAGERGPRFSLTQTFGGASSGGADTLLERATLAGLAANDPGWGAGSDHGDLKSRRLETRFGYGFAAFGDRFTATPELGFALSDAHRELVFDWRLAETLRAGLAFGLDVEGARRESRGAEREPVHRIGLGFGWRLEGAQSTAFETRFEATRLEAANDGAAPEYGVALRLNARF